MIYSAALMMAALVGQTVAKHTAGSCDDCGTKCYDPCIRSAYTGDWRDALEAMGGTPTSRRLREEDESDVHRRLDTFSAGDFSCSVGCQIDFCNFYGCPSDEGDYCDSSVTVRRALKVGASKKGPGGKKGGDDYFTSNSTVSEETMSSNSTDSGDKKSKGKNGAKPKVSKKPKHDHDSMDTYTNSTVSEETVSSNSTYASTESETDGKKGGKNGPKSSKNGPKDSKLNRGPRKNNKRKPSHRDETSNSTMTESSNSNTTKGTNSAEGCIDCGSVCYDPCKRSAFSGAWRDVLEDMGGTVTSRRLEEEEMEAEGVHRRLSMFDADGFDCAKGCQTDFCSFYGCETNNGDFCDSDIINELAADYLAESEEIVSSVNSVSVPVMAAAAAACVAGVVVLVAAVKRSTASPVVTDSSHSAHPMLSKN